MCVRDWSGFDVETGHLTEFVINKNVIILFFYEHKK